MLQVIPIDLQTSFLAERVHYVRLLTIFEKLYFCPFQGPFYFQKGPLKPKDIIVGIET